MKKQFLFFAIMLMALVTGCKKDDSPVEIPIKNLELPKSDATNPIKSTQAIAISGAGFTKDCELWLNAATKADGIKAEIIEVTNNGVVFTATAASGEQSVTLRQGGGEFQLGSISFQKTKLIKQIAEKHLSQGYAFTNTFVYDKYNRVSTVTDDKGNRDQFEYTDKSIKYNEAEVGIGHAKIDATIENGLIKSSLQKYYKNGEIINGNTRNYAWTYDTNGYISKLTETTGKTTFDIEYTWSNGNLRKKKAIESYTFTYSDKPNNMNISITDIIIESPSERMYGFSGKSTANLIESYTYQRNNPEPSAYKLSYEFDAEGFPVVINQISSDGTINYSYTIVYH